MKRLAGISGITLALMLILGALLSVPFVIAGGTLTNYTGTPPYALNNLVAPNILLLMDTSLSMQTRACDANACGTLPDGSVSTSTTYAPSTRYSGYFDSMRCYTYDAANQRFEGGSAKPTALKIKSQQLVQDTCLDNEWDGNLLNWITFRRVDALKDAMIGGECAVTRNNDGTCPPTGAPAKITIQSHRPQTPDLELLDDESLPALTAASQIVGRVPAANRYATPLYVKLRGFNHFSRFPGWFCVDDDQVALAPENSCDSGDVIVGTRYVPEVDYVSSDQDYPAYSEFICDTSYESVCTSGHTNYYPAQHIPGGQHNHTDAYWTNDIERRDGIDVTAAGFNIRLVEDTEPTGVIQQIGSKARFGLMVFRSDGGIVTVPIASKQSVNFAGIVTTRNTNTAAMVDAVETAYPNSQTPLAESLYEAARYVAQIKPVFSPGTYSYPTAFNDSGGTTLGTGTGSIGSGERTALAAGETCPAGYITDACGRDPYFYGENWATPSAVVPCCRTFVMIMTDGSPFQDTRIPVALQDQADKIHGKKCNGSDKNSKHKADGICNGDPNTPPSLLLLEHKTDYDQAGHWLDDVAFWAHTTDLRQATIPGIGEPGHDLSGMQNITVYTFFAFGTIDGREILMQTARQGGFVDRNGNNLPDLTGQTCTNPDGTLGESNAEWDQVNNITGMGGPDCIPDNYFESSNADDLRNRLFTTISRILEVATSGSAVSVLASTSTGEGMTFQSYFYSNLLEGAKELTWLGYLEGFFVDKFGNLREDTDGDGQLVLLKDNIIKLRYDGSKTVFDRYKDSTGTGVADATPFQTNLDLNVIKPAWEAGRRLALTDPGTSCEGSSTWPMSGNLDASGITCRRILTWVDLNNNGIVDVGERLEFADANKASLCPYLGGVNVASCGGAGQAEAADIINFIRGTQITGLRDRQRQITDDTGNLVTNVWKLGDIMASTPVAVGAPRERYDVIYSDTSYRQFYQRYKDRRQVVYVGGNDGMLHAFNAGYFSLGDVSSTADVEQLRFTPTPKMPGSTADCASLPCDGNALTTYGVRSTQPKLGAELWGFVPQDLLPQLRWLADPNYSHVYYVDLKPKVTDARIFCNDQVAITGCIEGNHNDHPGGWGTVLIGGFRFGGSCSNCNDKGVPRTVTADFDGSGQTTRVFLSSYFVLDITNPEKDPVLLWTFRDQDLGLTTAAPAVLRVNTAGGAMVGNEKWYVVFGTGPTAYDGSSKQSARIFIVDLQQGPAYSAVNVTNGTVRSKTCTTASPCVAATTQVNDPVRLFSTGQDGAFMGDASTVDADLDYRVDVIYLGSVMCKGNVSSPCNGSGPKWKGALWRLTTGGGSSDLTTWGVSGAPTVAPTKVISTFACATPTCLVGPVLTAPTISTDDLQNFWVFFGTGRMIDTLDKGNADTQYYFGIKDCVISHLCVEQAKADQAQELNTLKDVSDITVCSSCATTTNVSTDGGSTFNQGLAEGTNNLVKTIQDPTIDGWFTTLPALRERNLSSAILLGGTLFFTTFAPDDSTCDFNGSSWLYGMFFATGSGYTIPSLGTSTVGSNQIANRSISIGSGMPAQIAAQIGSRNDNSAGSGTIGSGSGCKGRITGFIQSSTGAVTQVCGTPALNPWSRLVNWRDM